MSKTFLTPRPSSFVYLRNSAEFSTKFIHARISTDCVLSLHAKRKLHNDIVNNSIWFDAIVHLIAILSLVYNAHRYNAILFACFALTIPSIFYALLLRRSSDCREAKKNFFDYSIVLIGKSFAMRDFVLIQMQKCSKNRAQKKHTTKMNTNSNGIRFVAYLSIFIHWFTAEMVRRSGSFFDQTSIREMRFIRSWEREWFVDVFVVVPGDEMTGFNSRHFPLKFLIFP